MDTLGVFTIDILPYLMRWLGLEDQKSLRLVNKISRDMTERVFWASKTVSIRIYGTKSLEAGLRKLEDFRKYPDSAKKIQKLILVVDMEEVEKLKQVGLSEALRLLQGLRTVHWLVSDHTSPWAQKAIAPSLASLPKLSELFLRGSRPTLKEDPLPPTPLDPFGEGKLELLSIGPRFVDGERYSYSTVSKLLIQNPQIAHLILYADEHTQAPPSLLKDILPQAIPHAPKLQELTLIGPIHPYQHRTVYNNQDFWEALQREKIHLRDISISDNIGNKLFDYLSSFTGLERLKMLPNTIHQEMADSLAQDFYGRAIQMHASSLRELNIAPCFFRSWCFGARNVHAFDECVQLKYLQISIYEEDIFATGDPNKHVVSLLVQRAATLPKLRVLCISSVYSPPVDRSRWRQGTARVYQILLDVRLPLKYVPQFEVVDVATVSDQEYSTLYYHPEMVKPGEVCFKQGVSANSTLNRPPKRRVSGRSWDWRDL
ncbi:hypothetical protein L218DRAFT_1079070 [Marasmius fiardii PR-910]|nr:hypothetical protein L218DRAFT_1079070 [Marasmius fiardii PR-910]